MLVFFIKQDLKKKREFCLGEIGSEYNQAALSIPEWLSKKSNLGISVEKEGGKNFNNVFRPALFITAILAISPMQLNNRDSEQQSKQTPISWGVHMVTFHI